MNKVQQAAQRLEMANWKIEQAEQQHDKKAKVLAQGNVVQAALDIVEATKEEFLVKY